jgi:hypothetical protein
MRRLPSVRFPPPSAPLTGSGLAKAGFLRGGERPDFLVLRFDAAQAIAALVAGFWLL